MNHIYSGLKMDIFGILRRRCGATFYQWTRRWSVPWAPREKLVSEYFNTCWDARWTQHIKYCPMTQTMQFIMGMRDGNEWWNEMMESQERPRERESECLYDMVCVQRAHRQWEEQMESQERPRERERERESECLWPGTVREIQLFYKLYSGYIIG